VGTSDTGGGTEPGDVTWNYPVVTYPVEGKSMRVKLPRGTVRQGEHRVGATVRVYYDPCDPTQAAAKLGDFPGGRMATILAAVFVVIGAGCFWVGWTGGR